MLGINFLLIVLKEEYQKMNLMELNINAYTEVKNDSMFV